MAVWGSSLAVKGEVESDDDITIEGRVDGTIWCEQGAVTIAAGSEVTGNVLARDITVFGRASGQLVATEVVDLRPDSSVEGQIVTARLIVNDGAVFNGRAEPQHLEAAVRVARYQRQQKNGGPPASPPPATPAAPPRKPPIISKRSRR